MSCSRVIQTFQQGQFYFCSRISILLLYKLYSLGGSFCGHSGCRVMFPCCSLLVIWVLGNWVPTFATTFGKPTVVRVSFGRLSWVLVTRYSFLVSGYLLTGAWEPGSSRFNDLTVTQLNSSTVTKPLTLIRRLCQPEPWRRLKPPGGRGSKHLNP